MIISYESVKRGDEMQFVFGDEIEDFYSELEDYEEDE